MSSFRNIAVALVIGAMGTGSILAGEVCNSYLPLPSYNVNVYNITLVGNVIDQLDLNATATDPDRNPFVAAGGTSTVTAALDSNGNTVVTMTGSVSINSSDTFTYPGPNGTQNGLPHFGVDGTLNGGAMLPIISNSWSNNGSNPFALPAVSFSTAPPGAGATDVDYLTFFVKVTSSGTTVGQWFEEPFDGSKTPLVTLTNYTADTDTLSGAGYFISESFIPLDQLNFGYNPPTGYPSSPFIPLPSLDGETLAGGNGTGGAGGVITAAAVPEPSSLICLATGLLFLAGYCGRRK